MEDPLRSKLTSLQNLFLEENASLNLSAFRTKEDVWTGNIEDSLILLDHLSKIHPETRTLSFLDVGTGGGFPLLPLACALPMHQFVGLDATQKKIDAIGRLIEKLHIDNVSLCTGRAEELGHDDRYREAFNCVLSRAVAPLNLLLELTVPFAKVNGIIILWKGKQCEKELAESLPARSTLSAHLTAHYPYDLGEKWGERQLLIFEKHSSTDTKYPREKAKKRPL